MNVQAGRNYKRQVILAKKQKRSLVKSQRDLTLNPSPSGEGLWKPLQSWIE
jgi:hypothetical protein